MKYFLYSILFFGIHSCSNMANEHSNLETIANNKSQTLDSLYSNLYDDGVFNGVVLVAEKGEIIFKKAYGIANEENNRQLNTNTIFELASVSKQFTAMGIVLLQKQEKLKFDDPISKYINELSFYKEITIKDLLVHTGGLPDYMELAEEKWDKSKIATNDDIIKLFETFQPETLFNVNDKFEYSNTGYLILGTIIERVSNSTYQEFLQEYIFKPSDMMNTLVYRRRFKPQNINNYADGYVYSDSLKSITIPDNLPEESYVIYLDGIVGDGMVNSNLTDLYKWDRILNTNKLIDENDKKLIFSSQKTNDNKSTDYGFGWRLDSLKAYGKIAEHSGGWAGYLTFIERHLDNDNTIIILQNRLTPKSEIPLKDTRKILYNIPIEHRIELDSSTLMNYSGTYVSDNNGQSELVYQGGKLYYPIQPEYNLELIPVSNVKFILDGFSPEVTYTFNLDSIGNVDNYRVQQPEQGIDKFLKKLK